MMVGLLLLAQQTQTTSNPLAVQKIWVWLVVIVLAAILLGLFAGWIRRRAMAEPGPSLGFTLADLRAMRDAGQISDEEFNIAKNKMLRRTRAELLPEDEAESDANPGPPRDPDLAEAIAQAEPPAIPPEASRLAPGATPGAAPIDGEAREGNDTPPSADNDTADEDEPKT